MHRHARSVSNGRKRPSNTAFLPFLAVWMRPSSALRKRKEPPSPRQPTESVPKRIRTAFACALLATTLEKERQNERFSRHELALLRQLTGLDVTAAHIHYAPRMRLQPPPRTRKRAGTFILIGRDPSMTPVIQENASEVQEVEEEDGVRMEGVGNVP